MSGRLSTHVLDTAAGLPAAGIPVQLFVVGKDVEATLLVEAVTNADGRTDSPLLVSPDLRAGTYELVFRVGDYFHSEPGSLPFLDRIAIRVGISDPGVAYHVPLLVSPWSYSTYRGS